MYQYWICYYYSWAPLKDLYDLYRDLYLVINTTTPNKYLLLHIWEVPDIHILSVDWFIAYKNITLLHNQLWL